MHCLQTRALVHRYGNDLVLDGIDLQVPTGSIYGFLGPNGAGKTTTLRLLLGLLRRQQGEIAIFGHRLDEDRIGLLRRIGSMIESPSFYEHLSARENLALLQKVYRCPRGRIDEVLALVGLAQTGRKRAGQFSLGMKQRLGLAVALLHAPDLLILDEPSNGLDPNGIVEMRALLQRLNRELGITILVSSHLLPEVEKLATHVGILHRGRLMFQGTIDALQARQHQRRALRLRTGDDDAAQSLLARHGHPAHRDVDGLSLPALDDADAAALNRTLVAAGIDVFELAPERGDLERIFMDIVEDRSTASVTLGEAA
ncbi:ATP-binding cassette domain-containing protein [Lysobacter brunescens]|uniref:ATP-binding cassette domain-containing protein n=1 Tax=Lysobacter brunescens TaxID=262323 RepID=A0ABW2Y7W7_9GAMM